jgi:hypothetical protein
MWTIEYHRAAGRPDGWPPARPSGPGITTPPMVVLCRVRPVHRGSVMSTRPSETCPKCGSNLDSGNCRVCRQREERLIIARSRGQIPFPDGRWATETMPDQFAPRERRDSTPNVVRFSRLGGYGEECIDLDRCLRLIVGVRPAPDAPYFDPTTVMVYYLSPDDDKRNHRGIAGLGGLAQVQHGGAGYVEVHPLQIARDMHMHGLKLPPELERYRKILDLDLSLPAAIAAWEESGSSSIPPPEEMRQATAEPGPTAPSRPDGEGTMPKRMPSAEGLASITAIPEGEAKIATAPVLGPATPPPEATTGRVSFTSVVRDQVFISYSHRDGRFRKELDPKQA